ncbi:hypothetical protein V473_00665 [Sphingobium cupriresistens LL01]|uniref:TonB-denpendent receptor n=1 Tax=Sphingobium cupriresistens LL01 TaxID=1420583 RepID=A0A0J7Y5I3_9SPHN|nr:hypothetical protein V473_00665 [Sphingobium cupriresistens LL01]
MFNFGAMAQAQPDPSVATTPMQDAGEIVVTAQRREQRVQDVPASVTAIGAAELQARSVVSIAQVIGVAPSVQVAAPYGDGGPPNYTIRGISSTDASHNQSKPIAIYVDEGIRGFQVFELMPVFDVERVEVLSGPQGTLYGKNATGGAVNIITKAPTFDTEGYLTVGYGNFNTRTARGAMQAPLVSDILSARIAFTYIKDDGTIKQLTPGLKDLAQTDLFAIRGSLLFKPSPDFDATLRLYHVHSGGRNYTNKPAAVDLSAIPALASLPGALRQGVGFYESATDSAPQRDIQSDGVNLLMHWQVADAYQLTSVTTYDKGHWDDLADADGLPVNVYSTDLRSRGHQFVQELRVGTQYDGPFNWQAGVFYGSDKMRFAQRLDYYTDPRCGADCDFGITPNGTGMNTVDSFSQRRRSYSGYVRGEFKIVPELTVSGGVRQSHDKLLVDNYSAYVGDTSAPLSIPVFVDERRRESFNNTSFEAGLDWKASRDILLYASFKQGYRTGAVNGSALTSALEVNIAPPETAAAFEIGAKTSFFDRKLTVNLSAFTTSYKNQQIQASEVVAGTQTFPLRSIDKSQINGIEAQVIVRPVGGITFSAAASAVDPKYKKGTVAGISVAGNQIINAAKYKLNISSDFVIMDGPSGKVNLNLNANYNSRTYYDVYNTENISQKPYWLANGRISYDADRWSVAVYGKNLALLQRLAAVRGRLSLCADQAAAAKWWLSMPMASVSAEGPMPKALSTRRTSPLMPGCRHQGRACPLRRARMTSNPLIVA